MLQKPEQAPKCGSNEEVKKPVVHKRRSFRDLISWSSLIANGRITYARVPK
jgi:hypothetical protein